MFLRAILRPKAAERQAWGSTAVASDTGDHSHRGLLPYVLSDLRFLSDGQKAASCLLKPRSRIRWRPNADNGTKLVDIIDRRRHILPHEE